MAAKQLVQRRDGAADRRLLSRWNSVAIARVQTIPADIPGSEIVSVGLADLQAGRETPPALLVAMAAPRLRRVGVAVPALAIDRPSHRLYELLSEEGPGAHSRYNALVGRVVSFARATEHASTDIRRYGAGMLGPQAA